jgi:Protein of unknown function (DUF2948)
LADARFEDASEGPLRLRAETAEDLAVLSALLQDAVGQVADIAWATRHRRFIMLLNRFRWEDREAAERAGRTFERVRVALMVADVQAVRSSGLDPRDRDAVFSLLSLGFEPGEDGAGTLRLVLAGDGEIMVSVECVDVSLTDVARPHRASSGRVPRHGETA